MIRKPKEEDAAAIAAISNHYVLHSVSSFETQPLDEEQMRQRLARFTTEGPYFVYERQGKIAGFCYAHRWKERAAYRQTMEVTVYVAPDSTGLGIGRQLVQRLIDACRSMECHALIACITAENEASRRLFETFGFRRVSHFKQVGQKFDRWLDVVDYELLLDSNAARHTAVG